MVTALGEAIRKIRLYEKLLNDLPENTGYKRIIKREWDDIKFIYRSDEMHVVYEVENLFEYIVIFWSMDELGFHLVDLGSSLIDVEISIKINEMRGTDIGRIQLFND